MRFSEEKHKERKIRRQLGIFVAIAIFFCSLQFFVVKYLERTVTEYREYCQEVVNNKETIILVLGNLSHYNSRVN